MPQLESELYIIRTVPHSGLLYSDHYNFSLETLGSVQAPGRDPRLVVLSCVYSHPISGLSDFLYDVWNADVSHPFAILA